MADLKEECGIFGIYDKKGSTNAARTVYYGLFALQHRGQEAAGIAVNDGEKTRCIKNMGLVSEVFDDTILNMLNGNMAIGHVRYSTTGSNSVENAQPLSAKYAKGTLTVAHNGNIANAGKIRSELEENGAIFHSTSDSEIIAYLIARARINTHNVEDALSEIMPRLIGSYSLIIMTPHKIIGARDPHGIRPLCLGKIGEQYVLSSESCALDTVGATFVRDLEPGEIVVISDKGISSKTNHCGQKPALCIFEHIYFARPDSVIDGQSVNEARVQAGRMLAQQHPVDADVVIGVPDSGLASAIGYSKESGIPYGVGLIKNRYIGRTFIQPTQAMRESSVALKLNVLKANVEGKRVIMVDDSIVRGTTIANIVRLLKNAGATEVHVMISSPEFLYPCYFGTDIPNREQLACVNNTVEELRNKIGADSLGFLSKDNIEDICKQAKFKTFCKGCFTGKYPCNIEYTKSADKLIFE